MTIIVKNCDGCAKRLRPGQPSASFGLRTDTGAYVDYRLCAACCIALADDTDASKAINERAMATATKRANHGVLAA
jgi:hypothetical protein